MPVGYVLDFKRIIDIGVYKADLGVPLEACTAALPSVNQQQKTLANEVDEAARVYISRPLKAFLAKGIAEVEAARGREGLFSIEFSYDPIATRIHSTF